MIFLHPVVLLKLQALLDLKLIGVQSLLKLQALLDLKLIGVQSNHGVEYFEGPAVPTQREPISGLSIIWGFCMIWVFRIITAHCIKTRFSFQIVSCGAVLKLYKIISGTLRSLLNKLAHLKVLYVYC